MEEEEIARETTTITHQLGVQHETDLNPLIAMTRQGMNRKWRIERGNEKRRDGVGMRINKEEKV